MNNYNIISPFQLTVESDSKKNVIKNLINKNYINDKNIDEYSNQVILEDENKNKFNAQALFYKKYHSHSHYVPKVRIKFIPTTATSVYMLPIYRPPVPVLLSYPVRIARPISPISYPLIARTPIISSRPISPLIYPNSLIPTIIRQTPIVKPSVPSVHSLPIINSVLPPPLDKPSVPILNPIQTPTKNPTPTPSIAISTTENPELLTLKDISGLTQIDNTAENTIYLLNTPNFKQYIEPKLLERKKKLTINNNINTDKYTDIYFTSDLHADYRKLVQILVNAKLISIPSGIDIYTNQIYEPRIITESNWIKPNSLFIIIGDLVDGTRPRVSSVKDNQGSFELLLHLLLYNLKIKAESNNSDIIFTIGNHDLHSVLMSSNTSGINDYRLSNYIHSDALTFFQRESTRGIILSKFYELSPYLFLNLNNNEIVAVHGGLHNNLKYNPELNIDELIRIQNNINIKGLSEINYENFNNNKIQDISSFTNPSIGALWTRFYADSIDRQIVCKTIKENKKNYKFIVVGHCPTNNFEQLAKIMDADKQKYNYCERNKDDNGKGCVVIDTCRDVNNAPVLAFVDTALSQAFRTGTQQINQNRNIELLHLHHDSSMAQLPGRKYNIISRLEIVNNSNPIDIRIF